MAGAHTVLPMPYVANEALTKHRFVKLAGDEKVDMADTVGERVLGVISVSVTAAEATSGKAVEVEALGVAWVEASAAITRGARVTTANDGRAVTAGAGNVPAGIALKAAAAAGDLIPVLLSQNTPAA